MENSNKLGNPNKKKDTVSGNGCIFIAVTIIMLVIMVATCDSDKKESYSTSTSTDTSQSLKNEEVKQTSTPVNKVDQKVVKELRQYFTFKKDEFDSSGSVWVEPKNRPRYTNVNSVFCYFQKTGDAVSNFRFVIQYTADDWLFIENYIFNVDGIVFDYSPESIERDNNSTIWEWADNNVTSFDMSLMNALSLAKKVKVKFNGKQYSKTRTLTKKEISYIQRTIKYYRALGGSF
ncbi:hypothetical protein [uncultured Bacteroides sp.]|uniref:hypothetical protein n=1 Tax=uncultured Bacteroides sp. TaxID=162156 RepID=UPI002AABE012|nr:hypothetical protein [uncultured Bacteroides sp.]